MRVRLVLGLALVLGLCSALAGLEGLGEAARGQTRPVHASGGLAGAPAPDVDFPAIVAATGASGAGQTKLAVEAHRLSRPAERAAGAAPRARLRSVHGTRPLQFPLLI